MPTFKLKKKCKPSKRRRSFIAKILYVFCSLSVAFVIALIVWLLHGRNGQEPSQPFFQNDGILLGTENTCLVEPLVGDGYCDDAANNAVCDFDLNDCCTLQSERNQCHNCTCYVTSEQMEAIKEDNCPEMLPNLGDGICDLSFNRKEFFFDIGDCCYSSGDYCTAHPDRPIFYSANHLQIVECPVDRCIQSNNYCIPEELGDGICQDHNNGPYCDYDGGDCCSIMITYEQCCLCACHQSMG